MAPRNIAKLIPSRKYVITVIRYKRGIDALEIFSECNEGLTTLQHFAFNNLMMKPTVPCPDLGKLKAFLYPTQQIVVKYKSINMSSHQIPVPLKIP